MTNSILDSTKHALGVGADYDVFDPDIMMHINSAIFTLSQVGVGPTPVFRLEGNQQTWDDYLGERTDLEAVKSYLYIRVRLLFDPPQTSFHLNALEKQADEYLWRLANPTEGAP